MSTIQTQTSISPSVCSFQKLPPELYIHVFLKLKCIDLLQVSFVCKKFNELADDENLRKIFFTRDFPKRNPIGLVFRNVLCPKISYEIAIPLSWKDQYKYAYGAQYNLRNQIYKWANFEKQEHQSALRCFGHDSRYFFSGSSEGKIVIHDVDHLRWIQTLTSDDGLFRLNKPYLAFKQNEKLKVWTSQDERYQELQSLDSDGSGIVDFALQNDYLFMASRNGLLKVYTREEEGAFKEVLSITNAYRFHAKEDHLFIYNERISVLKNENGSFEALQLIEEIPSPISFVHYENDLLFAGKYEGSLKIWKKNQAGKFVELQSIESQRKIDCVSSSVIKEDHIIMGFLSGRILVYKKDKKGLFNLSQTLSEQKDQINALHMQGDYLLSGSKDSSAIIWELDEKGDFNKIQTLKQRKCAIESVRIVGDRFFVGYCDGISQIWDFSSGIQ